MGSPMFIHFPHSMDWFEGKKSEGTPIFHGWFPLGFPFFSNPCSSIFLNVHQFSSMFHIYLYFPHLSDYLPPSTDHFLSAPAVKASGTAASSSGDSSGAVTCATWATWNGMTTENMEMCPIHIYICIVHTLYMYYMYGICVVHMFIYIYVCV